jgi:hypothetical protein
MLATGLGTNPLRTLSLGSHGIFTEMAEIALNSLILSVPVGCHPHLAIKDNLHGIRWPVVLPYRGVVALRIACPSIAART